MSELIRRDALWERVAQNVRSYGQGTSGADFMRPFVWAEDVEVIIDAAPPVRCRTCKWLYTDDGWSTCNNECCPCCGEEVDPERFGCVCHDSPGSPCSSARSAGTGPTWSAATRRRPTTGHPACSSATRCSSTWRRWRRWRGEGLPVVTVRCYARQRSAPRERELRGAWTLPEKAGERHA